MSLGLITTEMETKWKSRNNVLFGSILSALDNNVLFIHLPMHDHLCQKGRYWQDDILQSVSSEDNHVSATTLPFKGIL